MLPAIVIYTFFLTHYGRLASAADDNEVFLSNDSPFTWSTPNPYTASETLIVRVDSGYLISVKVTKCDLAGEDGDFLVIKAGESSEESSAKRIFTYNLKTSRQYLVYGSSVFVNFEVHGSNQNKRSGASVTFQRYGDQVTTTTALPTTTNNFPTPSANESIYATVDVSGKTYSDYNNKDILYSFKSALVDMATEYCAMQNFYLSETITTANVRIKLLTKCPFYWPNSEECVQVTFAIPIALNETTSQLGYQLTPDRLLTMWDTLAMKHFNSTSFSKYSEPNNRTTLLSWTVAILAVVLLFFIALILVKRFSQRTPKRSSVSDSASTVAHKRVSDTSLSPHPLQSIPQLFENDYPMYEPGFLPTAGYIENPAFEDTDSEDEINIPIHFTKSNSNEHTSRESET